VTDAPATLPTSTPREAARLSWTLLGKRRGTLAACLLAFLLDAVAGLVAPYMLGRLVDLTVEGADRSALLVPVAAIGVAALVAGVATVVATSLLARVAEPALADLREDVLDRALHLDGRTIEAAGIGDVLSRVGDDVRLVSTSITQAVPRVLGSVLAIVLTAFGLLGLDWRLGLAGLAAIPFYVLGLRWYLPRSGPYYRREREANGVRAEAFLTGVHGSRTLRAFGLAEGHQRTVDAASWTSAQISIDVYRMLTRYYARNNRAELLGLLAILVVGFALVRGDAVTVGAVTAAALLFHRLFNPIGAVMALFDDIQSAGASLTRLAGLALLPATVDPPAARRPDAGLEVRDLHHEYAAGRPAVDDVSLTVAPGRRVAVVGSTGAGKSTLGIAVAGRLVPTRGEVLVGGAPVAAAGAGTVALVTQETHVFSGTVRDNLTLAAPAADDPELTAALAVVGADRWVAALDRGLDTPVGDGVGTLTPAQAQQLALARVVLADPPVVVLDEATAEAGSAGARDLEAAALAATEGRTTVMIAHRLSQAAAADEVVVMEAGRVIEQGPHEQLVAAGGRYAALWAAWSG